MDKTVMTWPPTNISLLLELEGSSETAYVGPWAGGLGFVAGPGKGVAIYDPQYTCQLIEDGIAENFDVPHIKGAVRLTEKGKEAVQLLRGEIQSSKYRMPDWLLVELARVHAE